MNPLLVSAPGIGESQRTLLGRLKRGGECTLAELEDGLTLNRETLRGHLKSLAADGLVERAGVRRNGPGRPNVLYRLTPRAEELFPRREGKLLRELASYLLASEHPEMLERFFTDRAERRRKELRGQFAGLDRRERLEEMARVLSDDGFVAEVVDRDTEPRLRLCHCPLRDLVAVSQLPCRAEMALVEELVGEPLHRQEFMPEGGHACTYSLQPLENLDP